MPVPYPPLRLLSVGMATREEQLRVRRRRGYWIHRARDRQGMTLQALAELLGYSGKSISTISRWETGDRQVPSDKLALLAHHLSLPESWLVNPPETDDERLDRAVREAEELERQDAERAQAPAQRALPAQVPAPRRRTA